MELIVLFLLLPVIIKYLIQNVMKMLCSADISAGRAVNYRGKAIPAIGGMVFVPILLIAGLLLLFLYPENTSIYLRYLLLVLSMAFVGIVDDLLGDRRIKGLVRHFASTMKGNMTTGFLKAFAGLLTASIVSLGTSDGPADFLVDIIIIALFANTINLLDLRPGRAAKVYIVLSAILLYFSGPAFAAAAPLLVMIIAVIFYIRYDLKEICMLGDTGANILGITLGYYGTVLLEADIKLLLAVILVFVNVVSERVSISEIIIRNRFLNFIDSLGRGQKKKQ